MGPLRTQLPCLGLGSRRLVRSLLGFRGIGRSLLHGLLRSCRVRRSLARGGLGCCDGIVDIAIVATTASRTGLHELRLAIRDALTYGIRAGADAQKGQYTIRNVRQYVGVRPHLHHREK